MTTISNPRPVNRAGEVLYRNILGLIAGKVMDVPFGLSPTNPCPDEFSSPAPAPGPGPAPKVNG